ncbi:hypothetical protein HDV04_001978 [Boothiomyces sp. JEL0838]|nr:hypothetical protein HDV04_001978 [Boothiomyces sp. JEL0838]
MSTGIVFQSGWFNSSDCTGPPASMYIFTESNPTPVYTNLLSVSEIPYCGTAILPVPIGCCTSFIDYAFGLNYHSLSVNYVGNITDYTPPVTANNIQYCSIFANDDKSLDGYNKTFYLGNNQCIENVKCDLSSNTITIYNNTGCNGYQESFPLSNATHQSVIFGNISVSSQRMNGIVKFIWEQEQPYSEGVPLYQLPIEIFGAACYVVALIVPTITTAFYTYKYFKTRAPKDLFFAIAQFTLTLNFVMEFIFEETVFASDQTLFIYDFFSQLTNCCSLLTVFISLNTLSTIYPQFQGTIYQKLVYIAATILHLGTMYWYGIADLYGLIVGQDDNYLMLNNTQTKTYMIWRTTYIIFEMIPSIVILLKIFCAINQRKLQKMKQSIHFMAFVLFIQILLVIAYEGLNIVVNYTLLLYSDRAYMSTFGIFYCLQALNSLFVLIIYNMMTSVLEHITGKKKVHAGSNTTKNAAKAASNIFKKILNK